MSEKSLEIFQPNEKQLTNTLYEYIGSELRCEGVDIAHLKRCLNQNAEGAGLRSLTSQTKEVQNKISDQVVYKFLNQAAEEEWYSSRFVGSLEQNRTRNLMASAATGVALFPSQETKVLLDRELLTLAEKDILFAIPFLGDLKLLPQTAEYALPKIVEVAGSDLTTDLTLLDHFKSYKNEPWATGLVDNVFDNPGVALGFLNDERSNTYFWISESELREPMFTKSTIIATALAVLHPNIRGDVYYRAQNLWSESDRALQSDNFSAWDRTSFAAAFTEVLANKKLLDFAQEKGLVRESLVHNMELYNFATRFTVWAD